MASQAPTSTATALPDPAAERYRRAERALWAHYGLEPKERFINLATRASRIRVLEVGAGEPVLFVHGTVGLGAWPSLVCELTGFRCLVLERPGWGLSSAVDFSKDDYGTLVAGILHRTLDELGLDRVHVVGGSIGNVWALRLAAQYPARVSRIVLLGGSPILPEVPVPMIIRLLSSPIGALVVRRPETPGRTRSILRRSGHGASLDAGRIPDAFVDWRSALSRETASMRHEREMVRVIVKGRSYGTQLTFREAELAATPRPTLYVYGTADPVGTVELWRRAVGLLPRGELRLVDRAGHMPWLDDPRAVASEISRFLAAPV